MGSTLFEKVWDPHVVLEQPGEPALLYVDLHLVHEVTSAQAFEGLRLAGRTRAAHRATVATMDHNVPTLPGRSPIRWRRRSSTRCGRTARSSASPSTGRAPVTKGSST